MWKVGGLLLVITVSACALSAQDALSIAPEQCVFRTGDDVRWAARELDETGWLPASEWTGDPSTQAHFWLRCRLNPAKLAPTVHPVLQVADDASYEIYLNGQRIGLSGNVVTGSHTVGLANQYTSVLLAQRQPLRLAVRLTFAPTQYGEDQLPWILLGDQDLLRGMYSLQVANAFRSRWIVWVCYAVIAAAGLFFLALYFFDRSQRVLLWASLTWLCLALLRFRDLLVAGSVPFPSRLEYVLYGLGNLEAVFYIPFFFALARRPMSLFFKALQVIIGVQGIGQIVASLLPLQASVTWRYWLDTSPLVNSFLIPVFVLGSLAPLAAFWPLEKLRRGQMGLYFVCAFWMGMEILYMGSQIPWLHFNFLFFLSFQSVRSLSIAGVVIAMTLLLIQRIRQNNRERAALAAELRSAQEIQRILVPQRIESAPGFDVEAVFLPAQEVGGDFYRFRVLSDGAQWMLLGDVSGKGAAAGMTGAMLLGACEGRTGESPAALLSHLNRVLCESQVGGFATCLCARIAKDGTLVIANAGHLPPYLNQKEIQLESGLPLGMSSKERYVEGSIQLSPGNALTFLSDGVVEAQDACGELFGFERTEALSSKPAAEIAEAAQRFGQKDDITVLRVSFAAIPALAIEA